MTEKEFVKFIKSELVKYENSLLDKSSETKQITEDDVFIVWLCKTLQHRKALASTRLPNGMYYEFTYNGDKNECYVDAYKKLENHCVKL